MSTNSNRTAFVSHGPDADNYAEIARAVLAEFGFDVLSGADSQVGGETRRNIESCDLFVEVCGHKYGTPGLDQDGLHASESSLAWSYWTAHNAGRQILVLAERIPEREEMLQELVERIMPVRGLQEFAGETEFADVLRTFCILTFRPSLLLNRYRLDATIGAGGHGTVDRALDTHTGRTVAIKRRILGDAASREHFQKECSILRTVTHPNLPEYIDSFEELRRDYLVMEYVEGEDLEAALLSQQVGYSPELVLEWADQILEALEYLHDLPLRHLDIKPGNLKIAPDGRVKLLDFGLSKAQLVGLPTLSTVRWHTPEYAAPEQLAAGRPDGGRTSSQTDLYSLGATIWALLVGQPPAPSLDRAMEIAAGRPDPYQPVCDRCPSLHRDIGAAIDRAMALAPTSRPASAAEMRYQLTLARKRSAPSPPRSHLGEVRLDAASLAAFYASSRLDWWRDQISALGHHVGAAADPRAELTLFKAAGIGFIEQIDDVLESSRSWGIAFIAAYVDWVREVDAGHRRTFVFTPNDVVRYLIIGNFLDEVRREAEPLVYQFRLLQRSALEHSPRYKHELPLAERLRLSLTAPSELPDTPSSEESWPPSPPAQPGSLQHAGEAVVTFLLSSAPRAAVFNRVQHGSFIVRPDEGNTIAVRVLLTTGRYSGVADEIVEQAQGFLRRARLAGGDLLYFAMVFRDEAHALELTKRLEDKEILSPDVVLAVGVLSNTGAFREIVTLRSKDSRFQSSVAVELSPGVSPDIIAEQPSDYQDVVAEFVLEDKTIWLTAPDDDTWGKYNSDGDRGYFPFHDNDGRIELSVEHESALKVSVHGRLSMQLLDDPDPNSQPQQEAILRFYVRAFTAINAFISRYRLARFDLQARPVSWTTPQVRHHDGRRSRQFRLRRPATLSSVRWFANGSPADAPTRLAASLQHVDSKTWSGKMYSPALLDRIQTETELILNGREINGNARETAYELLLRAAELAVSARNGDREFRQTSLTLSVIGAATACDIYVRDFVLRRGTPLQQELVRNDPRQLSTPQILDILMREVPGVDETLADANPELLAGVRLLYRAADSATRTGQAAVAIGIEEEHYDADEDVSRLVLKPAYHRVTPWMIFDDHFDTDEDDEFGCFVLDVLAVIGWLEEKGGLGFLNDDVKEYWTYMKARSPDSREDVLREMH